MSRLQDFLNTDRGLRLALRLGRLVPPGVASAGVRAVAAVASRRTGSRMVGAVKSNLSVVLDMPVDHPALVRLAADVIYHSAIAGYEFFHKVGRGWDALGNLAAIPPELFALLGKAEQDGKGIMAVTAHLGALDLLGVAITATEYQVQVISYSKPPAGYEIVNSLRSDQGLIMTPASKEAMLEAAARLDSGGIVFTALDRPVPPGRRASTVEFFGRPTRLWDGYTRLALGSGALLLFVWMERTPEGDYRILFNEPIDCAAPPGDAEAVTAMMLRQGEAAIRAHPEQWLMFFPLWPEAAGTPGPEPIDPPSNGGGP